MAETLKKEQILAVSQELLELRPAVPAQLRLQRDVLGADPKHPDLLALAEKVRSSLPVRILEQEQRGDGGWGAFHSRSTTAHQKTASTETAVERALSLGLDRACPILARAEAYLKALLKGEIRFPDYHEKNERWPIGMRLFTASTLALIHPEHPLLDPDRALWVEIVKRAFQSGAYCEEHELAAHADLTVQAVKNSYLIINNRYTLNLVGSTRGLLPPAVERTYMHWLWSLEEGIGYLGMPLGKEPPLDKPGPLDRWFTSLERLLKLFPASAPLAEPWILWIWNRRKPGGWWDFGSRAVSSTSLPFADSWKRKGEREKDWSTRVLLLAWRWGSANAALSGQAL
ncbi:MAG: hypothetical protein JXA25_11735 [Anaerolineales bacterium]|nr:hypothetical protein [Anaerolineales bacterium]